MYKIFVSGDWYLQIAVQLREILNKHKYPCEVVINREQFYDGEAGFSNKSVIYILNLETKNYQIIDFKTMVNPKRDFVVREVSRRRNCVKILKTQFRPGFYRKKPYLKVHPYTFYEKNPRLLQGMLNHPLPAKIHNKLFFIGQKSGSRGRILQYLEDLIGSQKRLSRMDYYDTCARHSIGLALPGFGNITHREIEYFGLEVACIMPKLKNVFHNSLIPDYHYVSLEINTTEDEPEEIAQAIRNAYEKLKKEKDYLSFIVSNAKTWYNANVRFPRSIMLTLELLGFELNQSGLSLVPRVPGLNSVQPLL